MDEYSTIRVLWCPTCHKLMTDCKDKKEHPDEMREVALVEVDRLALK